MSFEAEKITGWGQMGLHFFLNIKYKRAVELELFSNLQHVKITFPSSPTFIINPAFKDLPVFQLTQMKNQLKLVMEIHSYLTD